MGEFQRSSRHTGSGAPRTLVAWVVAALVAVSGLPLATVIAPPASATPARAAASSVAAQAPPANDIEAENLLPGNPESEWQVSGSGDPSIQGYTTDISADRGGSVSFKVDLDATDARVPHRHLPARLVRRRRRPQGGDHPVVADHLDRSAPVPRTT